MYAVISVIGLTLNLGVEKKGRGELRGKPEPNVTKDPVVPRDVTGLNHDII